MIDCGNEQYVTQAVNWLFEKIQQQKNSFPFQNQANSWLGGHLGNSLGELLSNCSKYYMKEESPKSPKLFAKLMFIALITSPMTAKLFHV